MSLPTNNETNTDSENSTAPVSDVAVSLEHSNEQNEVLTKDLQQRLPSSLSLPKRPNGILQWAVLILLLLCIGGLTAILMNSQKLSDWWRLRGYHPPPMVAQLALQDTMNSYTRHLFYLNKPQILNTVAGFRKDCPENENTIVLGCYHSGQNGIFIYNVPDPTLAGVQQVTAAHEVLHSIYARLSSKERTYIDGLLENYYKHDLHDQVVLAEVKLYQQTEPHDVMDEMNSTFGTEISSLPAPLEAYYKQYFTNRAVIVAYEQQYQGELTNRLNVINADDEQLSDLQQTINSQETSLNGDLNQLNAERTHLNQLLNEGQAISYNAGVGSFNSLVDSYNQEVANVQAEISTYNQLVNTRNLVAGQLTTLDKALDTRMTQTASSSLKRT